MNNLMDILSAAESYGIKFAPVTSKVTEVLIDLIPNKSKEKRS